MSFKVSYSEPVGRTVTMTMTEEESRFLKRCLAFYSAVGSTRANAFALQIANSIEGDQHDWEAKNLSF